MCHGQARHDGTPFNLIFQVMCEKCRATGPIAKTAREALAAWAHQAAPLDEAAEPEFPDIEFEEAEKSA